MSSAADTVIGFCRHDHAQCKRRALAAVDTVCKAQGLRLTAPRRRVLEVLLESHKALGAYDILARLSEDGRKPQPPTAYRALEFLTRHGFAHRIERLNAYVACARPGTAHHPVFMICESCNGVAEAEAPERRRLAETAASVGFRVDRAVLELLGDCPDCRADAP